MVSEFLFLHLRFSTSTRMNNGTQFYLRDYYEKLHGEFTSGKPLIHPQGFNGLKILMSEKNLQETEGLGTSGETVGQHPVSIEMHAILFGIT